MKLFRSARTYLFALLLCVVPASSFAGVFISVNVAPPPLVVYDQPICPNDGYMWTPGYWGYGDGGYYWVPGAWVPAPQPGFLWTPGYWGFTNGAYVFNEGYWGPHIGFYGGVNYGFGYMGNGFAGGEWRSGHFFYNTAIVHVNTTIIHNTFVNETIVHNTTIVNDRHVSFNGPGGVDRKPSPEERTAMNEHHIAPTSAQQQHIQSAAKDPQQRFNNNHGKPATVAAARPMTAPAHTEAPHAENRPGAQPAHPENKPATQPARPENRPAAQPARPENRPTPETARPENRPAPESRPAPQSHPAAPKPESHPAPKPASHPAPKEEKPRGRSR